MSAAPSASPAPTAVVGTDHDGLVWGYRFFEDGAAEIVQGRVLRETLDRRERWTWLHFDLEGEWTRSTIADLPHLPPAAIAMLFSEDERQHVEAFGPVIAGVVADYERLDALDVRRIVRWQFVMAPHLFVSARRRPGHTLHQVHLDLQAGRPFQDVLSLFSAIIHEFTTATSLLLHDVSNRLDELEEQLLDRREERGRETLGLARRQLVRLRRQTTPLRAVLVHMLTEPPAWFDDRIVADCRRATERLDSLADDLESLQERANALHDELEGHESEQINKRLTLLSVVSAMLLPPTFITGLFGMNVGGLPWRGSALGFADACGLMLASVVLTLIVLKRIRLL